MQGGSICEKKHSLGKDADNRFEPCRGKSSNIQNVELLSLPLVCVVFTKCFNIKRNDVIDLKDKTGHLFRRLFVRPNQNNFRFLISSCI